LNKLDRADPSRRNEFEEVDYRARAIRCRDIDENYEIVEFRCPKVVMVSLLKDCARDFPDGVDPR